VPRATFTQWSTVEPFIDNSMKPSWVADENDQLRLASYALFEGIWRNVPETFELMQRGSDANPIYLPSAKKCIEATNRYLGVGFNFRIDGSTADDRQLADNAIRTIFRREKFYAKFGSLKRMHLVRGDAIWHITADPDKPLGRRISLNEIHPSKYHPIYDINDNETLLGVHLVEKYIDPEEKNKALVKRQTYRKVVNANGPATITSELGVFEADGWDDRQLTLNPDYKIKPWSFKGALREAPLPPSINTIPVYHVSNQYESENPFGVSELAGFERVIAALNQGITDEELSLAYMGLGLYFSTAPRPSGGWVLPPGSVVDAEEGNIFERVDGVTSVTPSLDHLSFLNKELKEGMGTPDIAIGNVDVSIAQSGIALALQMGPILTRNREKEDELLAVHDNMFFDLVNGWLPAYEELSISPVTVEPFFDDPMPKDRAAIIKEVTDLLGTTPPLISAEYGRKLLTDRLGYDFPKSMGEDILAEIENSSKAQAYDPFAQRVIDELSTAQGAQGIPVTANGSSGA
jgi:hypothetical protein